MEKNIFFQIILNYIIFIILKKNNVFSYAGKKTELILNLVNCQNQTFQMKSAFHLVRKPNSAAARQVILVTVITECIT